MKPLRRQHLIATIFPASMLDAVRWQSQICSKRNEDEIVFVTGQMQVEGRCVRLIAAEFLRAGKTIRVTRTL